MSKNSTSHDHLTSPEANPPAIVKLLESLHDKPGMHTRTYIYVMCYIQLKQCLCKQINFLALAFCLLMHVQDSFIAVIGNCRIALLKTC